MALQPLSALPQDASSLALVFTAAVTRQLPLSLLLPNFSWVFLSFSICELFFAWLSSVDDVPSVYMPCPMQFSKSD